MSPTMCWVLWVLLANHWTWGVFGDLWHRYTPRSGISGSLNFLSNCKLFYIEATPFYIPTSNIWSFQFLYIFVNVWFFLFFFLNMYNTYWVWSGTSFDLYFPGVQWRWTSFCVLICHSYIFFWEVSIHILCLFFQIGFSYHC